MRLVKATFDNFMELSGKIDFPNGKVVVIYGANLQGKTNVINAIRYAFLKRRKGGRKKAYDEFSLPTKEEVLGNQEARVEIIFSHGGKYYKLVRSVRRTDHSVRDRVSLFMKVASNSSIEWIKIEEDPQTFLTSELKTRLIDVLFAPESISGFKRLYSRDVEEALVELFKEVSTAKKIAEDFIKRVEQVEKGAQVELEKIKHDYKRFVESMAISPIKEWREYKSLKEYEPRKTAKKLEALINRLNKEILALKSDLIERLKEKKKQAKALERLSDEATFIKLAKLLKRRETLNKDLKIAKNLVCALSAITLEEGEVTIPNFNDQRFRKLGEKLHEYLAQARKLYREAMNKAVSMGIHIGIVDSRIEEKKRIKSLLLRKEKVERLEKGWLTKIKDKVHAVIPLKLLRDDPAYAQISPEPIPWGDEKEVRAYIEDLEKTIRTLEEIKKKWREAEEKFNNFKNSRKEFYDLLQEVEGELKNIERSVEECIRNISNDLAILGLDVKIPSMERERDIHELSKCLSKEISVKRANLTDEVNKMLSDLNIHIDEFTSSSIEKIIEEIEKRRKELTTLENCLEKLQSKRDDWLKKDEAYVDYTKMLKFVTPCLKQILNAILRESVDETMIREKIRDTFDEIMEQLVQMKLIEAKPLLEKHELRAAKFHYKGREVTHPAGAEKVFYSLAILTALAHCFDVPILMDEVANNLDTDNLEAFFRLIKDFTEKYGVQYILTVKKTKDFDLHGWVKDLADCLVIYELDGKRISLLPLGNGSS